MKKFLSLLLSLCLAATFLSVLGACNDSRGTDTDSGITRTESESLSVTESVTAKESGSATAAESESESESDTNVDPAAILGIKQFRGGYYLPMSRNYFEKYGNVYQLDENRNFSFYYDTAKVTITASFNERYLLTALNVPTALSVHVQDIRYDGRKPVSVTCLNGVGQAAEMLYQILYRYNETGELKEITGGNHTVLFDYRDGTVQSVLLDGKPDDTLFQMVSVLDYEQFDITQESDGNYVFSALETDFVLIPVTPEVMCAAVSTLRSLLPVFADIIVYAKHARAIATAQNAANFYMTEQMDVPETDEIWYAYTTDGYWVLIEQGRSSSVPDEAPDLTGYTDVTSVIEQSGFSGAKLFVPAP